MAACISPLTKRDHKAKTQYVFPCGKCFACHANRIAGWAFRISQEERVARSSYFITLTYNNKNLPLSGLKRPTFKKTDCQNFFKRLRHLPNHDKIKYYLTAEYGGQYKRPHYHILIFNALEDSIREAWNQGFVHFGKVEPGSIHYVLGYISAPSDIEPENDDRQKEFSLMSKKMGLQYITPQMFNWHRNDLQSRLYVPIENGKKISMPRYYKDKFYSKDERKAIGEALFLKDIDEFINKTSCQFKEELDICIAKVKQHSIDQRKKKQL